MNFLTNQVRKYYEKKLTEATQKLKFHQKTKKHLKTEQKTTDDKSDGIGKEITIQNELIAIWEKNIIKIKEQIEKL